MFKKIGSYPIKILSGYSCIAEKTAECLAPYYYHFQNKHNTSVKKHIPHRQQEG
jgi:hypothetical protein